SIVPIAPSTSTPTTKRGIATMASAMLARAPAIAMGSGLGGGDQLPQLGVLLLVLWPDLLHCQLAERLRVGLVDDHAAAFQQLLGLGQRVGVLSELAHHALRFPSGVRHQLLLLRAQRIPHAE